MTEPQTHHAPAVVDAAPRTERVLPIPSTQAHGDAEGDQSGGTVCDMSQAQARAAAWLHRTHCPGHKRGNTLRDCETRFHAEAGWLIAAMMPSLVREIVPKVERRTLNEASQKLWDWAEEIPHDDQARRTRRRTIQAAARKIAPEMTDDEMRQGIADLLGGMSGRVCRLDAAGRSIDPTTEQGDGCA